MPADSCPPGPPALLSNIGPGRVKVDQGAADAFVAVATADDGGALPTFVDEGAEVALRFTMEPEQMFGTLRLTAAQPRVTRGPAWEAIVTLDYDTAELPSNGVDDDCDGEVDEAP